MTDAQIIKFAQAFRDGLLDGQSSYLMCAAVSRPLASLLRLHGVPCEVAEGGNGAGGHTWIELADGRVLDPTADQYNFPCFKQYPPIYLGEPTELHDPELGYDPASVDRSPEGQDAERLDAQHESAVTNEDSADARNVSRNLSSNNSRKV